MGSYYTAISKLINSLSLTWALHGFTWIVLYQVMEWNDKKHIFLNKIEAKNVINKQLNGFFAVAVTNT